ncbi:Fic/DOC family protein [Nocardiopsis tropica]|uniref:Fic/DOC family protein n=1 Tax=Tsukamurella strandjordii TaxID=147577 RepID=UPI0031DC6B54
MAQYPWDTGDHDADWVGYFVPGTSVLRNRVGAVTARELEDAENDLVEVRVIELRERPDLAARRYDLHHLSAIHRHLFRDVYEWAGHLRTVGIEKGDESFCPPGNIAQAMQHVAGRIAESSRLRKIPGEQLPREVAYLYDYVNFAHPFREGNGRATREFFNLLLAERGAGLAWDRTDMAELHDACHQARAHSDLSGLESLFARIVDDEPAYDF